MAFEKMPIVKTCCCGCTLRVGTLILLWLGAVSSTLSILATLIAIAQVPFSSTLMSFLIKGIIAGIYAIGIYGIEKERPSYLKPYLGLQIFYMVLIIIIMVIVAIFGTALLTSVMSSSDTNEGAEEAAVTFGTLTVEIFFLLPLGLAFYFYIVVLSFYKELRGEIPQ